VETRDGHVKRFDGRVQSQGGWAVTTLIWYRLLAGNEITQADSEGKGFRVLDGMLVVASRSMYGSRVEVTAGFQTNMYNHSTSHPSRTDTQQL